MRTTLLASLLICLFAASTPAAIINFFDASQPIVVDTSGATSETIISEGYQFTRTLDKWWYSGISIGGGEPTGRMQPVVWPDGIDAQAITAGPNGLLPAGEATGAQITIKRVDGDVFDMLGFTGKIMGSTAGAGAMFEVMPMVNGEDALNNPLFFQATGYAGQSFTHSTPTLQGYDAYKISLWMDFALMDVTFQDNTIPEPSSAAILALGASLLLRRRRI